MSAKYRYAVETPAEWGLIDYPRGTGFVDKDGRKEFFVRLRADNDPMQYTVVEVKFYSRNARALCRAACGKKRTTQELIDFLQAEAK